MNSTANDRQVGGCHYSNQSGLQHWDIVHMFNLDYFQGNITKYVFRHKEKNGKQDLEKAIHYLEKYKELYYPEEDTGEPSSNYVDQSKDADIEFCACTSPEPADPHDLCMVCNLPIKEKHSE